MEAARNTSSTTFSLEYSLCGLLTAWLRWMSVARYRRSTLDQELLERNTFCDRITKKKTMCVKFRSRNFYYIFSLKKIACFYYANLVEMKVHNSNQQINYFGLNSRCMNSYTDQFNSKVIYSFRIEAAVSTIPQQWNAKHVSLTDIFFNISFSFSDKKYNICWITAHNNSIPLVLLPYCSSQISSFEISLNLYISTQDVLVRHYH